jgi:radical SAM protein with 4Fe4S-binding SPASM domain
MMSQEHLQVVISRLKDFVESERISQVNLYWQGGEICLMPLAWVEEMLERFSAAFAGTKVKIRHSLQSNLVPYRKEWSAIIKEHFSSGIGSSLDYPNKYRGYAGYWGEAFNQKWKENFDLAQEEGMRVGVISLLNEDSIALPPEEFLRYYVETMGVKQLQLNLPFSVGNENNDRSRPYYLDPDATGKFLAELYEVWVDETKGWADAISISPFNGLREAFGLGTTNARLSCTWSGNCTEEFFSIGPDCSVSLCDCWVTSMPEFTFGNLLTQGFDELISSKPRHEIRHRMESILTGDCATCDFLAVCFGGCPIRSYGKYEDLTRKDHYCETYKQLFHAVLEQTSK